MGETKEKRHLLFVCTANQQRSPTAADLFQGSVSYEAKSCGVHPWSPVTVNAFLLEWADWVICMEEGHRQVILEQFPEVDASKIRVLEIPDVFERGDPELVKELVERVPEFFEDAS